MKQWWQAMILAGLVAVPGLVHAEPTVDVVKNEVERLERMKAEDPAAYEEAIRVRQDELRRRLAKLKERDQVAHDRLAGSIRERRRAAAKREFEELTRLAQTNPEEFRKRVEARQRRIARRLDRVSPEQLERVYGAAAQRGVSRETLKRRVEEIRRIPVPRAPTIDRSQRPSLGERINLGDRVQRPSPRQRSFDDSFGRVIGGDSDDPQVRRRRLQGGSGGRSGGGGSGGR